MYSQSTGVKHPAHRLDLAATLFYSAWHLISTQWQCQAPCPQATANALVTRAAIVTHVAARSRTAVAVAVAAERPWACVRVTRETDVGY